MKQLHDYSTMEICETNKYIMESCLIKWPMHQAITSPKIVVDSCATRMHPSPKISQIKRLVSNLANLSREDAPESEYKMQAAIWAAGKIYIYMFPATKRARSARH